VPAGDRLLEDEQKPQVEGKPEDKRMHFAMDLGVPRKDFCGHAGPTERKFHAMGYKSMF